MDEVFEEIEAVAWRLEATCRSFDVRNLDVRIVDGKLRDICVDGDFRTIIDGDWFSLMELRDRRRR